MAVGATVAMGNSGRGMRVAGFIVIISLTFFGTIIPIVIFIIIILYLLLLIAFMNIFFYFFESCSKRDQERCATSFNDLTRSPSTHHCGVPRRFLPGGITTRLMSVILTRDQLQTFICR